MIHLKWAPRPYSPGLSGHKLGQSSVIDKTAASIIAAAEPRLRKVIGDERARVSNAVIDALPYAGASAMAFLATTYIVPGSRKGARLAGYGLSVALLGVGAWQAFDGLSKAGEAAPASTEKSGTVQDIISSLTDSTSRQLAAAIVAAAEPRVRKIIEEERARAMDVAQAIVPWAAASVAAFLGTAYFIPESKPTLKAGGYLASAGAAITGLYSAAAAGKSEEQMQMSGGIQ
jgi:uncharacterized membrane protein